MTSLSPAEKPDATSVQRIAALRTVMHGLFALSLVLALGTHSNNWRVGPLTWLPMLHLGPLLPTRFLDPDMQQASMAIGVLTILPLALWASWIVLRILEARTPGLRRPWRWGWPGFTWPLLGLTGLALLNSAVWLLNGGLASSAPHRVLAIGSLALTWLVYLYIVNEQPRLTWPLAVVIVMQGLVGVTQFIVQRDLGLAELGELSLDPATPGVGVLLVDGVRWLRAYGLTGHPNLLGTLLTLAMLLVLPDLWRAHGLRRAALTVTLTVGLVGLLASASRAAWLAFGLGAALFSLAAWQDGRRIAARAAPAPQQRTGSARWLPVVVLGGAAIAVVTLYGRQFLSRFLRLDSAIEARSLFERGRDAAIALRLIVQHPWQGVGFGNYLAAGRAIDPAADIIHSVPLLATAELGLLGGLFWAWLTLAPFVAAGRASRRGDLGPALYLAPWLALAVIGLWHNLPWITSGLRATILFALALGVWANANRYAAPAAKVT